MIRDGAEGLMPREPWSPSCRRADRDRLPLRRMQLRHGAGPRRRDFHGGLRRLDLDDGLVQRDLVALLDQPTEDVGLGESLAQVGECEVTKCHQNASDRSTASRSDSTCAKDEKSGGGKH